MERNQCFRYFESVCPQKVHKEINRPSFTEGFEKCHFVKIIKTRGHKVNEAEFLKKENNLLM